MKKLYGQEWLNHREAVLTKLRIQGINLENYYCEEMMIDELYQEVKDDYERFYENRNFLKDKYSKELTEKTIDHIFYLSRNTGSREKYYHIASLVKSLLQYGNDDTLIKRIVLTLMKKYPNRPAFKQELAKILR